MDQNVAIEQAMQNAAASVRMEGFAITEEMQDMCRDILNGKRDLKDCLDQLTNEKEAGEL